VKKIFLEITTQILDNNGCSNGVKKHHYNNSSAG
jgi:hypothetical protein